jgi:peptidoglycan/LPS O-acetylase OafA/YrhL
MQRPDLLPGSAEIQVVVDAEQNSNELSGGGACRILANRPIPGKGSLSLVQVYRGFAALLVVLYHADIIVTSYFGSGANALLDFFAFGKAGVQFFFVLSGFIIFYIHRGDIGVRAQLPSYAAKRLIRIYPVYIFTTLLLVPFWFLIPTFGEPYHRQATALVLSLLLIPQSHDPHLSVAWTLIHEMIFYTLFATLLLHRRLGIAVFAAWFAAIGIVNLVQGARLWFPFTYLLSVNNLLFGFGIAAALLAVKQRARGGNGGVLIFVLGNVIFLAVGVLADQLQPPTAVERALLSLAFGVASFLILLAAKNRTLDAIAAGRPVLRLLGDASFSIYLIHYPALSGLCKAIHRLTPTAPPSLVFIVVSTLAVVCGLALHVCVEKPTLELLRRRLLRPPADGRPYPRSV